MRKTGQLRCLPLLTQLPVLLIWVEGLIPVCRISALLCLHAGMAQSNL